MKFTRERPQGIYTIHAVEEGQIAINSPSSADPRDADGRLWLTGSFIITPHWLHQPWRPRQLAELLAEDLLPLQDRGLEVLLLGCGAQMDFPATAQLAALMALGIGHEVMDSAAACRTYNILASEGRQVAAAILQDRAKG